MELSAKILSDIVVFSKYARYLPKENRRENWTEIVDRYRDMMCRRYPQLSEEILDKCSYIQNKLILPSMRALQFAGRPIEINPSRIYNCSYLPIDHPLAFSETMFLLLGGSGVGYSVQKHHIDKLPSINKPTKKRRFLVGDSIEGWADAVKVLFKSYFTGEPAPSFDFSDIRAKGTRLVTSGGKAPGPEPLKRGLFLIQLILDRKEHGSKLTPIECHDIMCHIADTVLSGGIRRASLISFFSADDEEMLTCKSGSWWEENSQRGRSNNSMVLLRNRADKESYNSMFQRIIDSGSGEPGVFWTNDKEILGNPCNEISLRAHGFCNLTTINSSEISNQKELEEFASIASFFGTLQAGFTNFHYLRPEWQKVAEKEALLGVSITGIASGKLDSLNLKKAAKVVLETNEKVAKAIGISKAARTTCVKPEGTSSCVLGTSSGIHAWHAPYYLRRMRLNKDETIYNYFKKNLSDILEDDWEKPNFQAIAALPIKAPESAIFRNEPIEELLERVSRFHMEWVAPGHRKGVNTHNVSCTVSVKEDEWDKVRDWMWDNRNNYNGIALFPFDYGTHRQPPFEDISKEEYEMKIKTLHNIDLNLVTESEDQTAHAEEIACAGGQCTLTTV